MPILVAAASVAFAQEPQHPVRHDTARAGREFLVLRHQIFAPGSHERFYQLSRDAVWPLYEKIGARVVGQWRVVDPTGAPQAREEGYRLARYRSYNHWAATRRPGEIAGDGGDLEAGLAALASRSELLLGSDGPIFLEGEMAPGGPYDMPPLDESWVAIDDTREAANHPVRHLAAKPATELLTLRHFRIRKGMFEEFHRLSRDGVWPYFEKMGARMVGQWLVVHPDLDPGDGPAGAVPASPDYDDVYMMARYAGYEHWQASRPAVMHELGGDGEDWKLCRDAIERRRAMTIETSVRFLEGHWYGSPPIYTPASGERWAPASEP